MMMSSLLKGNIPSVVYPLANKGTVAFCATTSITAQCAQSIRYVWQVLTEKC